MAAWEIVGKYACSKVWEKRLVAEKFGPRLPFV